MFGQRIPVASRKSAHVQRQVAVLMASVLVRAPVVLKITVNALMVHAVRNVVAKVTLIEEEIAVS